MGDAIRETLLYRVATCIKELAKILSKELEEDGC
jgi:hypothetical protein